MGVMHWLHANPISYRSRIWYDFSQVFLENLYRICRRKSIPPIEKSVNRWKLDKTSKTTFQKFAKNVLTNKYHSQNIAKSLRKNRHISAKKVSKAKSEFGSSCGEAIRPAIILHVVYCVYWGLWSKISVWSFRNVIWHGKNIQVHAFVCCKLCAMEVS